MNKFLISIVTLLFITFACMGQKNFRLRDKSQLKINGTSTIHDWEMKSNEITGTLSFDSKRKIKPNKPLRGSISEGKLMVKVESIKSERGETMDKKMRRALKYDVHPMIEFSLTNIIQIQEISNENGTIEGMITIAGEQRKLNLSAAIRQSNGTISIKGKKELKLSDFNISPPTAMFGQI